MSRLLAVVALVLAVPACIVREACSPGYTNGGDYCADLRSDPRDCGECGASCAIGDYCSQGLCYSNACYADGSACGRDANCCSGFCASDGLCGCITRGNSG